MITATTGSFLMYPMARYRSDLTKASRPVKKSMSVFGKSLLKFDPFKSFGPCVTMCVWFIGFLFQFAFFTTRKFINH